MTQLFFSASSVPPPTLSKTAAFIQKGRLHCALKGVANTYYYISEKIQAMLSILGVGSCGCLTSYNSDTIYLTCKRICRRNMTDSKRADCQAFFTAVIPDLPHENTSSKTKEVLTLTSVRLEHFLLNHQPLCLSYISAF